MTINKFIKVCSRLDGPLGDFANDIIREEDFPFMESAQEVLEIIENRANRFGQKKVYVEFKEKFQKAE